MYSYPSEKSFDHQKHIKIDPLCAKEHSLLFSQYKTKSAGQILDLVIMYYPNFEAELHLLDSIVTEIRNKDNTWIFRQFAAYLLELVCFISFKNEDEFFCHKILHLEEIVHNHDEIDQEQIMKRIFDHVKYGVDFLESSKNHRDIEEIIYQSQLEGCQTFFRYFIQIEDIFKHFFNHSESVHKSNIDFDFENNFFHQERDYMMNQLPEYEKKFLNHLINHDLSFQLNQKTPNDLFAGLCHPQEYHSHNPVNSQPTSVLSAFLPGSGFRFQIKGTGKYPQLPFYMGYVDKATKKDVITHQSHVLGGGASLIRARKELENGLYFEKFHHFVFNCSSLTVKPFKIWKINEVSFEGEKQSFYEYFTENQSVRNQMGEVNRRHIRQIGEKWLQHYQEEWTDQELIKEILEEYQFTHLLYINSTPLRLKVYHKYLSDTGPAVFFHETGHNQYTEKDSKRFIRSILEELAGSIDSQGIVFHNPTQYRKEIFSLEQNRQKIEKLYLRMMGEIGAHWGALLGIGANTNGNGFHEGNIGLKRFWDRDHWNVKLIFHDLDYYFFIQKDVFFDPNKFLSGFEKDYSSIFDPLPVDRDSCERLADLYYIQEEIRKEGRKIFLQELQKSFQQVYAKLGFIAANTGIISRKYEQSLKLWLDCLFKYDFSINSEKNDQILEKYKKLYFSIGIDDKLVETYHLVFEKENKMLRNLSSLIK